VSKVGLLRIKPKFGSQKKLALSVVSLDNPVSMPVNAPFFRFIPVPLSAAPRRYYDLEVSNRPDTAAIKAWFKQTSGAQSVPRPWRWRACIGRKGSLAPPP